MLGDELIVQEAWLGAVPYSCAAMAQHDTSANLGHWKATLDSVIGGARDPPPTGDVDALNASRKAVLEEAPVEAAAFQMEREKLFNSYWKLCWASAICSG